MVTLGDTNMEPSCPSECFSGEDPLLCRSAAESTGVGVTVFEDKMLSAAKVVCRGGVENSAGAACKPEGLSAKSEFSWQPPSIHSTDVSVSKKVVWP